MKEMLTYVNVVLSPVYLSVMMKKKPVSEKNKLEEMLQSGEVFWMLLYYELWRSLNTSEVILSCGKNPQNTYDLFQQNTFTKK